MDPTNGSSEGRKSSSRINNRSLSMQSAVPFGDEEGMSAETFRQAGKELVDLICQYAKEVDSKPVHPLVKPGFLINELPAEAPKEGEEWAEIVRDIETKIIPGITHWSHQQFHAHNPSCRSFPSIMGNMLSSAMGCIGMTWYSCPACTELEVVVHDWFAKALGLPPKFLHSTGPKQGGGGFQPSESDAVLVSMLAARHQRTHDSVRQPRPTTKTSQRPPDAIDEAVDRMRQLTAYCSSEADSCVARAARLCMVHLRVIEADHSACLSPAKLKREIEADVDQGFVPFWVVATIGTYATASSDNLEEIAAVCQLYPSIWLHVDASYGGNALLCPEMRYLSLGIEHADSISVCPDKWALVNYDCTCFWTSDYMKLIEGLVVNPTYLQYEEQNDSIDYRNWGVPLSRRFRALILWFTLRSYGLDNLQKHIRNHCLLAERFRSILNTDRRLMIMNSSQMRAKCRCQASKDEFSQLGVVCFRVLRTGESKPLPPDQLTELLLAFINQSGQAFMSPVRINDHFCIRYCITAEHATHEDVDRTAKIVQRCLDKITHAQLLSMARSMTQSSVGNLGAGSSGADQGGALGNLPPTGQLIGERQLQLRSLRYLTHTMTVPVEQLYTVPRLQGGGERFVVPATDDNIIDDVDLRDLVASLQL